jgi:hypothetical protein
MCTLLFFTSTICRYNDTTLGREQAAAVAAGGQSGAAPNSTAEDADGAAADKK